MCGENCGKAIAVFCLAFGMSVAATNFFTVEESTIKACPLKMVEKPLVDDKNCVPVDGDLKFQNLTANEQPKISAEMPAKSKTAQKETGKKDDKSESKPRVYVPAKDSAELKTLLHKEKCYEFNGRE